MEKPQLSKEQIGKIIAGVMFSGLFIYFYTVYFWLPLSNKIAESSKKVASIESDIFKAKLQKAKYKDLEARLLSLKTDKENAQKKLPKERKFPDLLKTVTQLSAQHNIKILSLSPEGNRKEEYFMKASYQMSVKGSYHALAKFLTAIGLEERILTVENLTIAGAADAKDTITATFTLMAYQYNG